MSIKENNNISINNNIEKNSLSLFIYKLIIILVILKIIFYKKVYKIFENPSNLKVCLCTLGKKENMYAREFVEHYKKYDIDKIFIYDNNEVTGESFDLVLEDYIIL